MYKLRLRNRGERKRNGQDRSQQCDRQQRTRTEPRLAVNENGSLQTLGLVE